ncbi:hypothetical protein GCM10012279_34260 [Micromonospora yangpuensis]|nr:hypothetical protein GCM10012279_34260 [Micromonospora yangpuensis]
MAAALPPDADPAGTDPSDAAGADTPLVADPVAAAGRAGTVEPRIRTLTNRAARRNMNISPG